jgi:hypothetical protein
MSWCDVHGLPSAAYAQGQRDGKCAAESAQRLAETTAHPPRLPSPPEYVQHHEEPTVTDTDPSDLAAQVTALREGQRVRLVYGPKDGNTLTVEGVLGWGSIGRSVTVGAGTVSLVVRNANGSPHPDLIAVEVLPPLLPAGVGAVIDATVEREGKRRGVRCIRNKHGWWLSADPVNGFDCHRDEHIVAVERVIDPGEERS